MGYPRWRAAFNQVSFYLFAVCRHNNHVRSWQVARFRGRISTQPGSLPLASFSLPTFDASPQGADFGPFGDYDQTQLFVQKAVAGTPQVVVRDAATGARVALVEAVDGSHVTAAFVHECSVASRVGSRSRRFLATGHANGTVQVWDLNTALETAAQPPTAGRDHDVDLLAALHMGQDEPTATTV